MTPEAKLIYDTKEKIQDLEDEKNLLIVKTLKYFGWEYSDKLKGPRWLWHKKIIVSGLEREVFLNQEDAWSVQIFQTLNEEFSNGLPNSI